jgi:pseudouridylate synthase
MDNASVPTNAPNPSSGSQRPPRVALETTLLLHGVPRGAAMGLAGELAAVVRGAGAEPALVAVVQGRAVVGVTDEQLGELLATDAAAVPKLNTANLGVALALGRSGATTVSTTMELAAASGIRVFATGGLGGVHSGWQQDLDVSADLMALTRFPVAVVTAGVKSILDVAATREALETLGVPVVGWRTERFPAFYMREIGGEKGPRVDQRFDEVGELARYVRSELARTGRGIVVANPILEADEISQADWGRWLAEAERRAAEVGVSGREVTPYVLGQLHEVSGGATLRANIALVKSNAHLAGELAAEMAIGRGWVQ